MPEPTADEIAAKAEADRVAAEAKAAADAAAGEKKFSQADLDRIAGDTRAGARAAAEKDLLAKLGVEDLAAAEVALKAAKDAEAAKLTETERLTRERDEAVAEKDRTLAEATRLLAMTRLEGGLRDAGINPDRIEAALKVADTSALSVDGTDVTGLSAVIDSVKAISPEWFGTKAPGAVDASGGGGTEHTDWLAAPRDELAAAALKYGVKL